MTELDVSFKKILADFVKFFGDKAGPAKFQAWLNVMGLDASKPYGPGAFREVLILGAGRVSESLEGFNWATRTLELIKEDEDAKYYKVTALLALTSMNGNDYGPDELIRGARTLAANGGIVPNINHTGCPMEGVLVIDSEEEEGRVECILRVEKKARSPWGFLWVDHFDHAESVPEELHVYHVSIEAECRGKDKTICSRLFFTGLAALTKKVLPGVPLTEIEPVEGKESLDMDSPKIEGLPCRCELMKARREALEDPGAPTLETRINWIEDDITRLWRAVDETNRVIQVVIAMSRKEGAEVLQEVPVLASTESPTDMNGDPNPDHVDPFPGAEPAPADNPVDNAGIPAGPPVTTPEDPDGEPSCEPGALAPEAEPPVEPGALSPPTEPHIDILVDDGLTREQARFIATLEALFKRA